MLVNRGGIGIRHVFYTWSTTANVRADGEKRVFDALKKIEGEKHFLKIHC